MRTRFLIYLQCIKIRTFEDHRKIRYREACYGKVSFLESFRKLPLVVVLEARVDNNTGFLPEAQYFKNSSSPTVRENVIRAFNLFSKGRFEVITNNLEPFNLA